VTVAVRPLAGEEEARQAFDVLRRAFDYPRDDEDRWVTSVGPLERTRAVFVDGRVASVARVRPFGQFFGGRRVPLGGFSPVGTAPEYRGRGYARLVTIAHFEAQRERGEVLAGLYPASTPLYRSVGFGLAGVWAEHSIAGEHLRRLPASPEGEPAVRPAGRADLPAIRACYAAVAPTMTGWLDRPEVWWDRILGERWDFRHVYVVDGDAGLAGYVVYEHTAKTPTVVYGLRVLEVVAGGEAVARALWRLVGSSSTMAREVSVVGPPEHPLLLLLPEQTLTPTNQLRSMLRLVDAPGAVAARGYPAGLRAAADLEIVDDRHCPWNNGLWRLEVEDGKGSLAPGGRGTLRLGPQALATLWSGYASPEALAAAGLLEGAGPAELSALAGAFAGPTPWMPDFY
jgi:predicted acetyltransferase